MQLRSPSERYIKYLLLRSNKHTEEQIVEICNDLELFYVDRIYLTRLRMRCIPPTPFRPSDRHHAASRRFLNKEGVLELFQQDDDTKRALRLVALPRVKEFVEAMLLTHAPALAISSAVQRDFNFYCPVQTIERYQRIFWDINALNTTQLRTLINARLEPMADENAPKEAREHARALKKASYLDARKLAADLPYSPMTALITQMRMGLQPGKLELAKTMMMVQAMAAVRTLEATMYGSPQDANKALNFSIVVRNMSEALESVVKPDEALREQLQQIALRTETTQLPSIHQLSAGKHTVDLQPTQAEQHDRKSLDTAGDADADNGTG